MNFIKSVPSIAVIIVITTLTLTLTLMLIIGSIINPEAPPAALLSRSLHPQGPPKALSSGKGLGFASGRAWGAWLSFRA